MLRPALLLLAASLVLAACDRGGAPDDSVPAGGTTDEATAADEGTGPGDFERTWLGVLPCADCDGIQTRLQLSRRGDDLTYALEETYLGADGDAVFTQQGRWEHEGEDPQRVRLDPESPTARRYLLRPDGALDQLDRRGEAIDPDGQYRLQRL